MTCCFIIHKHNFAFTVILKHIWYILINAQNLFHFKFLFTVFNNWPDHVKAEGGQCRRKKNTNATDILREKRIFSVESKDVWKMDVNYCLILHLCLNTEHIFSSQELEKIAPKEKGITEQSVKEVVQSLVDDGLVDTDKIGTSVYFWAFPRYSTQLLYMLNQSKDDHEWRGIAEIFRNLARNGDFFNISHHSVKPDSKDNLYTLLFVIYQHMHK